MRSLLAVALLALLACVVHPYLVPERAPAGGPMIGLAEAAGVRVLVNGDAWRGDPYNLGELVTPVQVTIENRGEPHLRVAYADFSLLGASGFRYPALAPITGQPPASQVAPAAAKWLPVDYHPAVPVRPPPRAPPHPRFSHHRFYVAPHFFYLYPGLVAWSLAFPYDPLYYQRHRGLWPAALPTQDMLEEALPEGVLEDGGRVTGFLYFQSVHREARVTFELKLVDATDGKSLGVVSVPLSVRFH